MHTLYVETKNYYNMILYFNNYSKQCLNKCDKTINLTFVGL